MPDGVRLNTASCALQKVTSVLCPDDEKGVDQQISELAAAGQARLASTSR